MSLFVESLSGLLTNLWTSVGTVDNMKLLVDSGSLATPPLAFRSSSPATRCLRENICTGMRGRSAPSAVLFSIVPTGDGDAKQVKSIMLLKARRSRVCTGPRGAMFLILVAKPRWQLRRSRLCSLFCTC